MLKTCVSMLAGLALLAASSAIAQPEPGSTSAREGVRRACQADALKFCPNTSPGPGGGLMRCMREHVAEVSGSCKAAVAQARAERKAGQPQRNGSNP
jgi:hypothetical protein